MAGLPAGPNVYVVSTVAPAGTVISPGTTPVWTWGVPCSWSSWTAGGPMMNSWSIGSRFVTTNRTVAPGFTGIRSGSKRLWWAVTAITVGPTAAPGSAVSWPPGGATGRARPASTAVNTPGAATGRAGRCSATGGRGGVGGRGEGGGVRGADGGVRGAGGGHGRAARRRRRDCRVQAPSPKRRAPPAAEPMRTAADGPGSSWPAGSAGGSATPAAGGAVVGGSTMTGSVGSTAGMVVVG